MDEVCTLDHGFVYSDKCRRNCLFYCESPYKKTAYSVTCNIATGKWTTSYGEKPCTLGVRTTTYKPIDFLFTPVKIPTYKPFHFEDYTEMNVNKGYTSHHNSDDFNSASIFGMILGGIVGFMILFLCLRICIAKATLRRRQTLAELGERQGTQRQQQSQRRIQQRPVSESNNGENGRERFIILRIRRYLCAPLINNPYRAFRDSPEPPPYDAESSPPPAYEETEEGSRSATESRSDSSRSDGAQTSEIPSDPPPPYTANIV